MLPHLALASMGAALLTVLLAGCSAAGTTQTPASALSSPAPTASDPMTEPQAEHTASAAPLTTEVTCENVLTNEEYAAIVQAGLTFRGALSYAPPAAEDMVDDGALSCTWRRGDLSIEFARLAESDEGWTTRSAELSTEGWTVTDTAVPHPGAMVRFAHYDRDLQPAVARIDGVTYFAEPGRILRSLAGLEAD